MNAKTATAKSFQGLSLDDAFASAPFGAPRLLAMFGALLISVAGMAGIRAYANTSAQRVLPAAVSAAAQPIQTLPTVVVRPTAADYERAFGKSAHPSAPKGPDAASLEGSDIDMPYYSFAEPAVGVR